MFYLKAQTRPCPLTACTISSKRLTSSLVVTSGRFDGKAMLRQGKVSLINLNNLKTEFLDYFISLSVMGPVKCVWKPKMVFKSQISVNGFTHIQITPFGKITI